MVKKLLASVSVLAIATAVLVSIGCGEKDGGTGPTDPCAGISTFTVLSPKAGDTLKVGTTYAIKWCFGTTKPAGWIGAYPPSSVGINLFTDGGLNDLGELSPGSIPNTQLSFSWTPTAAQVNGECNIRVYAYSDKSQNVSSGTFVVIP